MNSQGTPTKRPPQSAPKLKRELLLPQFQTLELLDKNLTPTRRRVANEVLLWLNSPAKKNARNHALIVGPPGSGKSHLLSYLQKLISQYHENTHAIVVQEETRSIPSLFDFIVSCLRYCETVSTESIVDKLKSKTPEPLEAIMRLFDEYTDGKPTAIFIEDFSDLFDNMDKESRSEMQTFFAERPHVKLIAASAHSLEEKQNVLGTMSRMFNIRKLQELSLEETSKFLGRLLFDEKTLPLEFVPLFQTLHHLTGGNLGLMKSVGRFLVSFGDHDLDSLFTPLASTILIPHYTRRMGQLGPEQHMILRAVAYRLGHAVTTKELAEAISMPEAYLEEQLRKLLQQDILTRTEIGQTSYFDIQDSLLRSFLVYGDHIGDFLSPIVRLVSCWLKAEREQNTFQFPKQEVDDTWLKMAVSLFRSGSTEYALYIFRATLAIESSNPIAASHVFRHLLKKDPDAALKYLENFMGRKPLKHNHPMEFSSRIQDLLEPDAPHHHAILRVYRKHNTYLLESLIHRFVAGKESRDDDILREAQMLVDLLAPDVPAIELLRQLAIQFQMSSQGWENDALYIPIELRKLILKRPPPPDAAYLNPHAGNG